MADKIQVRRGVLSQAIANGTVLDVGELGYFTDLKVFVVGDGVTLLQNLPRFQVRITGVMNIPNGANSIQISIEGGQLLSGLGAGIQLPFTPSDIRGTIQAPNQASDHFMWRTRNGSLSPDGGIIDFSEAVPDNTYSFGFEFVP